jgi:malate synthase
VEITGPAEPKMMINALNSGARVFMADLEDSLSPTWANVVGGQAALRAASRRELAFDSPEGKAYRLNDATATLVMRPARLASGGAPHPGRWRADIGEPLRLRAVSVPQRPRVARARERPYLYLAKLENHHEARLWNEVFLHTQESLGIPRGSIRATVLIETILAAFEMDEILWELREHAAGLNAGRWDYIFSLIKKFPERPELVLPDRAR